MYTLKFYIKVFYVMGKALSGELSCTETGLVLKVLNILKSVGRPSNSADLSDQDQEQSDQASMIYRSVFPNI